MPLQLGKIGFDNPIVTMHPLPGGKVGIVTADSQIHLYSAQSGESEKVLRLNIPENTRPLYAFNPMYLQLLFGMEGSEKLLLIDLKHKTVTKRLELDAQSPTALAFSPDGNHFVCGTDQGRVLLWRRESDTLIARLHSFPEYSTLYVRPKTNFVSAIHFSDHEIATSGYGGSIVITDYRTQSHTRRYSPGRVPSTVLALTPTSVIAGNQDGTVLKIDREGKLPNQRLSSHLGALRWLMTIAPFPYLLAASEQNRIVLIDVDTMKILHERYIVCDTAITSLCRDGNTLYVATADGSLLTYDLNPLSELHRLIASDAYAEAYAYCAQEPPLKASSDYRVLEGIFEEKLEKAKELLETDHIREAKALLEPFGAAKAKEITVVLAGYANIQRLRYLFEAQKLSPFYGLIDHFPVLQSTQLFQQAEKKWSEHFSQAQKLMFTGKAKEAQAELFPYASVNAKRPLIQLLLHHPDILRFYSKAAHERNYASLSDLTQRYPILRELPSYHQLIDEAVSGIDAVTDALRECDFTRASLFLDELASLSELQPHYHSLKPFAIAAANLHHAITNRQWRSAYQLIDAHPDLRVLSWAEQIEKRWEHLVTRCEHHAIRADAASIRSELGNLISLPNRNERIGDIFRTAYQIQIRALLETEPATFGRAVETYCDLFGLDTEMRHLIKIAHRKGAPGVPSIEQLQHRKRSDWLANVRRFPDSIA